MRRPWLVLEVKTWCSALALGATMLLVAGRLVGCFGRRRWQPQRLHPKTTGWRWVGLNKPTHPPIRVIYESCALLFYLFWLFGSVVIYCFFVSLFHCFIVSFWGNGLLFVRVMLCKIEKSAAAFLPSARFESVSNCCTLWSVTVVFACPVGFFSRFFVSPCTDPFRVMLTAILSARALVWPMHSISPFATFVSCCTVLPRHPECVGS